MEWVEYLVRLRFHVKGFHGLAMSGEEYFTLIENNSQRCLVFGSMRELRRWAERHGWRVKRSPTHPNTYYTEPYVALPLFEE